MSIERIPPRDTITVEDLGSSLKIVIPDRSDTGYLLYILYLLFVVSPLVFVFVYNFYSGDNGMLLCVITLLLLVFGFLVIVLDLFNFSQIFRSLNGCEVLVVTKEALYLKRHMSQKPTEYLLSYIRDFSPHSNFQTDYLPVGRRSLFGNNLFDIKVKNATGGGLCFSYDNIEIRFANGADAHEGRRILDAIQKKFPAYKAVISPKIGYTDKHLTR
jgi:hypothetical protein